MNFPMSPIATQLVAAIFSHCIASRLNYSILSFIMNSCICEIIVVQPNPCKSYLHYYMRQWCKIHSISTMTPLHEYLHACMHAYAETNVFIHTRMCIIVIAHRSSHFYSSLSLSLLLTQLSLHINFFSNSIFFVFFYVSSNWPATN